MLKASQVSYELQLYFHVGLLCGKLSICMDFGCILHLGLVGLISKHPFTAHCTLSKNCTNGKRAVVLYHAQLPGAANAQTNGKKA